MRVLKALLALLLLLAVAALVVAWTLPARMAWHMLSPRFPVVEMQGVDGSIWNGHAEALSVAGQPLGALTWHAQVLPLLHGDLRLDARVEGAGLQGQGVITRRFDGSIELHGVQADLPGAVLEPTLGLASLELGGTLHLEARQAVIRNAWLVSLTGSGAWRDAEISGAAQAHLGTIEMAFSEPSPPTVRADIRDAGHGPLIVRGQLEALPTGYTLDADLRARDPQDLQTQEALQYLGRRQPDGSVRLEAGGQLIMPGMP